MKRNYKVQSEWLLQLVPAARRQPADPNDPTTRPELKIEQSEFITAGSAVAGRARFKVIGRWAKRPRTIDVHIPGLKRRLNALRPELYYGTDERPALRCSELVETLPAQNTVRNAYFVPSKPARPKWLETGEIAFTNEFAAEEDEETGRIVESSSGESCVRAQSWRLIPHNIRPESTHCGRSRPRPWTPLLGKDRKPRHSRHSIAKAK